MKRKGAASGIGKRQRGREQGAEGEEVIFYSSPYSLLSRFNVWQLASIKIDLFPKK